MKMKHQVTVLVPVVFGALLVLTPLAVCGQSLSVNADFNGDGCADLAIGIDGKNLGALRGAGAVAVLYGTATGLSAHRQPVLDPG